MMINDMKKNELTEQEMNGVSGGGNFPPHFWDDVEKALKKAEAERQEAILAEAANSGNTHAHEGGASGGW